MDSMIHRRLNIKKYLLDYLPQTKFAYSIRKLSSKYNGPCINVQRSSDSATLVVGFAGENLDVDALKTFVGASTGTVTLWYDQSGKQRNQTGTSVQIVNAGTLRTINGKPAVYFTGSSSFTNTVINTVPTHVQHMVAVINVDSLSERTIVGGASNNGLQWRVDTAGTLTILKQAVAGIGTSSTAISAATTYSVAESYDNTNYSLHLSGAADGSGSNAQGLSTPQMQIGNRSGGEPFVGYIPELLCTDQLNGLTLAQIQMIYADQKRYWACA